MGRLGTPGSRLRDEMDYQGVSMNELSRRTGLGRRTLRGIVRDGARGSLHSWVLIADALNESLDWLARGIGGEKRYDERAQ